MMVQIFLFAAAKEIVGSSKLELAIDDASTVGDLKRKLLDQYPGLKLLLEKSSISVDHKYVHDDQLLFNDAEVGLIPPVSGG